MTLATTSVGGERLERLLLTTGSGLARYQMSDVLRVDAPLGQVPCFTFLGRNDGVDLVGEKTSATTAQAVLDGLQLQGALPVTLLALDEARGRSPGYALLVECAADAPRGALQRDLADQVEKALQGKQTAAEALHNAQRRGNALLRAFERSAS